MNKSGKLGCCVALAVACLIFVQGSVKAETQKNSKELKNIENKYGTVVYSVSDLSSGRVISSKDIKEKPIELKKIPGAALTNTKQGLGRKLKYNVSKGQLLSHFDFEPVPKKVICAADFIAKNQVVKKQQLKEVWLDDDPRPYPGRIKDLDSVIGKRAVKDISAGTFLWNSHFK